MDQAIPPGRQDPGDATEAAIEFKPRVPVRLDAEPGLEAPLGEMIQLPAQEEMIEGSLVDALPVVSLGGGLGVDYGLFYVVSRIIEEYRMLPDLDHAIRRAVSTAGKAVLFTATTMIAGIVFWAWSFLKFQADMGILLAVWMFISMLGGLFLLPALIAVFKPKFITRAAKAKNAAGAAAH